MRSIYEMNSGKKCLFALRKTDLGKEYICIWQDEVAFGKLLVFDGTIERQT
jgi:hypothetical protein